MRKRKKKKGIDKKTGNKEKTLLQIREIIVGNRMFETTNLSKSLAKLYLKEYKSIKGIQSSKKIYTDFLIVAIASLNNMDIIITEDNKQGVPTRQKEVITK